MVLEKCVKLVAPAIADIRLMTNFVKLILSACLFGVSFSSYSLSPEKKEELVARGQYLVDIAGCRHCHTSSDGGEFAGGRVLSSRFGDFYSPNISSDEEFGIGDWTLDDFSRAITQGINPEGQHYYPVFPYTSYQNLSNDDVESIYYFLLTTTPDKSASKDHSVGFPFSMKSLLSPWKWLYMESGEILKEDTEDKHREAKYLVYAVAHCDQCHSPRSTLGGIDADKRLSGGYYKGEEGYAPPILRSAGGLKEWTVEDLETYLLLGETPDGEYAGGDMVDVIDNMTNYFTNEDIRLLAEFLISQ